MTEYPVVAHVRRKKVKLYRRRHLRALALVAYKAAAAERKRLKTWDKSLDRAGRKADAAMKGCRDA